MALAGRSLIFKSNIFDQLAIGNNLYYVFD